MWTGLPPQSLLGRFARVQVTQVTRDQLSIGVRPPRCGTRSGQQTEACLSLMRVGQHHADEQRG